MDNRWVDFMKRHAEDFARDPYPACHGTLTAILLDPDYTDAEKVAHMTAIANAFDRRVWEEELK